MNCPLCKKPLVLLSKKYVICGNNKAQHFVATSRYVKVFKANFDITYYFHSRETVIYRNNVKLCSLKNNKLHTLFKWCNSDDKSFEKRIKIYQKFS